MDGRRRGVRAARRGGWAAWGDRMSAPDLPRIVGHWVISPPSASHTSDHQRNLIAVHSLKAVTPPFTRPPRALRMMERHMKLAAVRLWRSRSQSRHRVAVRSIHRRHLRHRTRTRSCGHHAEWRHVKEPSAEPKRMIQSVRTPVLERDHTPLLGGADQLLISRHAVLGIPPTYVATDAPAYALGSLQSNCDHRLTPSSRLRFPHSFS